MSASSKKKLRKEQNAAKVAEQQRREKKEAKKMKVYSIVFILILVAVLVTCLTVWIVTGVKTSGVREKNTVALTLNDHTLSSIEMAYYYIDTINYEYSNNSWMLQIEGLDLTAPLDEQEYEEGKTWADYFIEQAATNARNDYAVSQAAKAANFDLPEDYESSLSLQIAELEFTATLEYGYPTLSSFLAANYVNGADAESYEEYLRTRLLAEAYYNYCAENNFTYDDTARDEYAKDKENNYTSFTYASYYLSYSQFLSGSTSDATDEEKNTARVDLKAAAEGLLGNTTLEDLDAAIAAMPINKDSTTAASTKNEQVLYTNITTNLQEWMLDDDRKFGDMTAIPNEATSTDDEGNETKEINGYTVVFFQEKHDNDRPLANVRHLLVEFEGGETDTTTGTTTYTDEQKAAAKKEAEDILAAWQAGDADEESFIELVKEKTDDTASAETGGLYEDITPEQGVYEEAFMKWSTDVSRQKGDVGIIETSYGYHIMYYAGDSETTYREYLIDAEMRATDVENWYNGLIEAVEFTIGSTRFLNTSIVLSSATEEE